MACKRSWLDDDNVVGEGKSKPLHHDLSGFHSGGMLQQKYLDVKLLDAFSIVSNFNLCYNSPGRRGGKHPTFARLKLRDKEEAKGRPKKRTHSSPRKPATKEAKDAPSAAAPHIATSPRGIALTSI